MAKIPPYPFLKWAGGKSRVAARVIQRLPEEIETYYEPFLGGGAIFFELVRAGRFKKAVLADANVELICAWNVVRNSLPELLKELRKKKYEYEKTAYLKIRKIDPDKLDEIGRAARFIYLNRTCFNGLYRVNLSGKFNVPFGKYTNPLICDEKNLTAVSEALQSVDVILGDFEKACSSASAGDAVYFDPPYLPVSDTSNFTEYTGEGFGLPEHQRLAKLFTRLSKAGVRCVLSNSVAPEAKSLYEAFDSDLFTGSRSIGGPAAYRKPAGEMIVFAGPRFVA